MLAAVSIGSPAEVVEVQDAEPYAHAVSSWRPRAHRILVSSGMVAALGPARLEPVLAHERSHVRHHHAWFGLVSFFAVAINPLLHWSARDLDLELERWADEDAAATVGRREMRDALQRAAFARLGYEPGSPDGVIGFSGHGVPARIEALIEAPARARWAGLVGYGAIFVLVAAASARALERSETLLEALRHLR
jgi:Zn-dependent protease with chaperone function